MASECRALGGGLKQVEEMVLFSEEQLGGGDTR